MGWGPFGLDGKTTIITGAARGIGLGCARLFLDAGANVVIADADADESTAALQTLVDTDHSGRVTTCTVDITQPDDIERMITHAAGYFGSVDVLVNNAGIYRRPRSTR